jgi:GlcNAc-P-P-Und epimerase
VSNSIALVGGSGFIGSRLADTLVRRGFEVRILDLVPSTEFPKLYRPLDVRDASWCRRELAGSDLVINLAAIHRDDVRPRERYYETNVGGARALCDAMTALGIGRLVFTSSAAVYGDAAGTGDEDTPLAPINDYGTSKAQAEAVYRQWSEGNGRSLVIIRPTVVFGPGNRGNVATLVGQIAGDRFMMVGRGGNVKSMAAVENLCEFIACAIPRRPGVEVYNYCDKPDFTTEDLVRLVRRSLGRDDRPLVRLPYWLGMIGGYAFDLAALLRGRSFAISAVRIRKFCTSTSFCSNRPVPPGFKPRVTLEEAMRRFVEGEHGVPRQRPAG